VAYQGDSYPRKLTHQETACPGEDALKQMMEEIMSSLGVSLTGDSEDLLNQMMAEAMAAMTGFGIR